MRKYRSRIVCDRCGRTYVTIKHKGKCPYCCKHCKSTMIRVLNTWEVC